MMDLIVVYGSDGKYYLLDRITGIRGEKGVDTKWEAVKIASMYNNFHPVNRGI